MPRVLVPSLVVSGPDFPGPACGPPTSAVRRTPAAGVPRRPADRLTQFSKGDASRLTWPNCDRAITYPQINRKFDEADFQRPLRTSLSEMAQNGPKLQCNRLHQAVYRVRFTGANGT